MILHIEAYNQNEIIFKRAVIANGFCQQLLNVKMRSESYLRPVNNKITQIIKV